MNKKVFIDPATRSREDSIVSVQGIGSGTLFRSQKLRLSVRSVMTRGMTKPSGNVLSLNTWSLVLVGCSAIVMLGTKTA